jgi:hypothetical protein
MAGLQVADYLPGSPGSVFLPIADKTLSDSQVGKKLACPPCVLGSDQGD